MLIDLTGLTDFSHWPAVSISTLNAYRMLSRPDVSCESKHANQCLAKKTQ